MKSFTPVTIFMRHNGQTEGPLHTSLGQSLGFIAAIVLPTPSASRIPDIAGSG